MNDKPWWAYACQIVIVTCLGAMGWMFADQFSWELGDRVPVVLGSQTLGWMMVAVSVVVPLVFLLRWLTGRRSGGFLETLFDFFS